MNANTKAVPEVKNNRVTVCAWCYPGDSVLADYPWLKGLPLSHGICPAHREEFFAVRAKVVEIIFDPNRP